MTVAIYFLTREKQQGNKTMLPATMAAQYSPALRCVINLCEWGQIGRRAIDLRGQTNSI